MSSPRAVTSLRALKVRPGRRVDLPEEVANGGPDADPRGRPGRGAKPSGGDDADSGPRFRARGRLCTDRGGGARVGDITSVAYCEDPWRASGQPSSPRAEGSYLDAGEASRYNHVTLRLASAYQPVREARQFSVAASCGVCGKASIDDVEVMCSPIGATPPIHPEVISSLPDKIRKAQRGFERTGGLHAAGLFDSSGFACGA